MQQKGNSGYWCVCVCVCVFAHVCVCMCVYVYAMYVSLCIRVKATIYQYSQTRLYDPICCYGNLFEQTIEITYHIIVYQPNCTTESDGGSGHVCRMRR